MSKLNMKKGPVSFIIPSTDKINRAGGNAYSQSSELELASLLLTSMMAGDSYYETVPDRAARFFKVIGEVHPNFAAKAAVYARDKFGMRTISHMAAMYLSKIGSDQFPKKRFFKRIVVRPDDMLEIAAAVLSQEDGKLPAAMKKGFSEALRSFDEYQLSKYRGEGKIVNIYDLINLCHPKPTEAISKIMKGTFTAPETYEVKLTQAGQVDKELEGEAKEAAVAANKAEAWKDLILSGKIGYMALLKNMRNIYEQATPEVVTAACGLLVDRNRIIKSRVFPFRFLTAMNELGGTSTEIVTAVSKALDESCANVPEFSGKTLVVVDESGSMDTPIGSIQARKLALTFAVAFMKKNPSSDLMLFSNDAHYEAVNLSDSVMGIVSRIKTHPAGTNFHAPFFNANKAYDRILIFSDAQGWMSMSSATLPIAYYFGVKKSITNGSPVSAVQAYRQKFKCNPTIYSIDMVGYGDMMFPEDKVVCLAGWNADKLFEVMKKFEVGIHSIVEEIQKVEI